MDEQVTAGGGSGARAAAADTDPCAAAQRRGPLRRAVQILRAALPRPDLLLLLIAIIWTLAAKGIAVHAQSSAEYVLPFAQAILPDLVFFSIIGGVCTLAYLIPAPRLASRTTLVLSGAVLGWAVLNAVWLLTTGVQLQPGVLLVLLRTSSDMWSLATAYLFRNPLSLVVVAATLVVAGGWFLVRLVRPIVPAHSRARLLRAAVACLGAALVFNIATNIAHRPGRIAYSGQIIGFSSHWYAVMNLVTEFGYGDVSGEARDLPRRGERAIVVPDVARSDRPNVLVIMQESMPFAATSLADPSLDLTPALARLAQEGAEFRRTYMPVPQTTKAFWATFTGMYPEILPGYAEAIITDEPYESLATVLSGAGYRTGFFQMSPGTFESLPAFFANTGFDLAWFFENLRRPETKVTMLSGDDFAMIDTMFEWVQEQEGPFLLTTISSIAHDPFLVPEWFRARDQQPEDRRERFHLATQFQDAWMAQILRRLDAAGLSDNTIVVVLGDHGESFRPEARRGRWGIFEELVRIPLVMRWPGVIEPGTVIDVTSSAMDITPTLLDLMGFDISEAQFDGINMLRAGPPDRRIYLSAWHHSSPVGFIEGTRKVIYWPSTDVMFEYDLVCDPLESDPRTLSGVERDELLREITEWQHSTHFDIPPRRFREALFYGHWQVFSSGRTGRSFFVDPPEGGSEGK